MIRSAVAAGVVIVVVGCGGGSDKTLRRLGSSKIDTAHHTSSDGDVRPSDERDRGDSVARKTSELRLRVRDRDALDPSQVRVPRADTVDRDDDADARPDKGRGRKHPKPKKKNDRWFIVR
jgi:hypothetical protein